MELNIGVLKVQLKKNCLEFLLYTTKKLTRYFFYLKDLISLAELSNVRLHNEVKVSSIEPKVGPIVFDSSSSSSTPLLFTSRIHEVCCITLRF